MNGLRGIDFSLTISFVLTEIREKFSEMRGSDISKILAEQQVSADMKMEE
jgi:hypothetical protein